MPYTCPACHDNGLPCFTCAGKGQIPTREEEEERREAEEREWEQRQAGILLEDYYD